MAEKRSIDISLDGVGEARRPAAGRRSRIDVPLCGPKRPGSGFNLGARHIDDGELEMVNRHHREIKELTRRAREQAARDASDEAEAAGHGRKYRNNG